MTQTPRIPKYRKISEHLMAAIREGRYKPGEQLPTERELAESFDVHRMTVRQATDALIKAGLIVKRRPQGMFVRKLDGESLATRPLNLISTAAESAHVSSFLEHGALSARQFGYRPRVIRLYGQDEHYAAELVAGADPSIVMHWFEKNSQLGQAVRRAKDRAVLLGARLDHEGVPSIVGDDELGIQLAVDHLVGHGHKRIGLLCSTAEAHHPTLEIQIHYFRQAMAQHGRGGQGIARHILRLKEEEIGGATMSAYHSTLAYLRDRRSAATAIIGLSEEVCHGALAACYELGLSVPGHVSLLAYSGTYRAALAVPPLTTIDVDVDAHVDLAMKILHDREQHLADADADGEPRLLHTIRPKLIERDSVAPPSSATND